MSATLALNEPIDKAYMMYKMIVDCPADEVGLKSWKK